jgi:two-component system LytT family response regulator
MLKTVIIDDEKDARFLLKHALMENYAQQVEIIAEADSVKKGIQILDQYQPDLVFLDIQMNDGTSFDLLEQIPDHSFDVIFVTAFNQFALKAFDFYALGYLVKPFKKSSLYNAVDKYIEKQSNAPNPGLKMLAGSYDHQDISKIVIPNVDGFNVLDLEDIMYIKSDNNYSEFYLKNGRKKMSSKTLKEYERLLTTRNFYRIHQQYLINLEFVTEYINLGGGQVIMKNGDYLPIGRRRIPEFRKVFL